MSNEYRLEKDKQNKLRIEEITKELPGYVSEYFVSMDFHSLSSNTMVNYAYEVNGFFNYLADTLDIPKKDILPIHLEELKKVQLEKFLVKPRKNGNSTSDKTKHRKASAIRSFYTFLIKADYIKVNPMLLVEAPKIHKKEIIKMDKSQVKDMLNTMETKNGLTDRQLKFAEKTSYRDIAIVVTLLGTGIRVSELVGLNMDDYDKKNACFHVLRKGGDEDVVYFSKEVETALDEYLEYERGLKENLETSAIFISRKNERISVRSVERLVKRYSSIAGIDKITPHKLRATFATNLYAETNDIYMVKDSLHHSSLASSQKYIGDVDKRKQQAGAISSTLFN